jgi:hypothetical protein
VCQESPSSSSPTKSSSDDFVGAWQLNPGKSPHSGIERESITIEAKDGEYKFTYDSLSENGTELNWWFSTDMKGDCVKATQVNGRPINGEDCITRLGPRKFVNENAILKDVYEASSDGRTLKLHRHFKAPSSVMKGASKEAIRVYDRVPQ